jgi:hypothetical protein
MLEKFLFQTRLGNWLLAQLEQHAGLAVVKADWLGEQVSPVNVVSIEPGQVETFWREDPTDASVPRGGAFSKAFVE